MLKRKIEQDLLNWKNSENKKCLIIEGARQVGKTYIIRHFGEKHYDTILELNFVSNPSYKKIFDGDLDIATIISNITLYTSLGSKINSGKVLLFLDEIQACPNARTALKFFALDGRFDVIASGSMLGIAYSEVSSYPTGYVEFMQMHPLTFEEFLWANNVTNSIIENLKSCFENKTKVNLATNDKMLELFKQYIVVGGMPDVVNSFVKNHNYTDVLKLQQGIIIDYRNDIAKYANGTEKTKATACFESIPAQLAKENKKFQYSIVEKNSTSKKYLGSLNWLIDAGIVSRCLNVKLLETPLTGNVDSTTFKIYMQDTGLFVSMLDDGTNQQIIEGNLGIYKGAIFENIIAQILYSNNNKLFYFNRNNSLEIDFVLSKNGNVNPIEVKAGNNKAKSLSTIIKENPNLIGYKLVNGNIGEANNIITLPLYMAMFL